MGIQKLRGRDSMIETIDFFAGYFFFYHGSVVGDQLETSNEYVAVWRCLHHGGVLILDILGEITSLPLKWPLCEELH